MGEWSRFGVRDEFDQGIRILKYSVSFIAKKIKGRSSRILRQNFPHLKE